jgi:hypothetical protein
MGARDSPGKAEVALHHAERARALCPDDRGIADLVARLREPLRVSEAAHLKREVSWKYRFDRQTGDVIRDD